MSSVSAHLKTFSLLAVVAVMAMCLFAVADLDTTEDVSAFTKVDVTSITIEYDPFTSLNQYNDSKTYSVTVLPEDATDKSVTWTLESGSDCVTLTDNGDGTCTVNRIGLGSYEIKATANDGSGIYKTCSGRSSIAYCNTYYIAGGNNYTETGSKTEWPYTFKVSALSSFLPTDRTLAGWSFSPNGPVDIQNGDYYTLSGTNYGITLYAMYEDAYVLYYDGKGVITNATNEALLKTGSLTTTVADAPETDERTFLGWSTTSDGAAEYQPGDSITLTGNTALYAVWKVYGGTVIFNANGGTGGTTKLVSGVTKEVSVIIPDTVPVYEGHTFLGWSESDTATVAEYQAGDTWKFNGEGSSSFTIYAVWATPVASITIDAGAGFSVLDSVILDPVVLPADADDATVTWSFVSGFDIATMEFLDGNKMKLHFDKAGYVEVRATANDGSGVYGTFSTEVTNSLRITYDVADGSGTIEDTVRTSTGSIVVASITDTVPTPPGGMVFVGWSTTVDGDVEYESGKQYTFQLSETGPTVVSLHAVYTEKTYDYTIRYNANGGTNAPASTKETSTGLTKYLYVTSEQPTAPTGMIFIGWNTDGTSEVATLQAGDPVRLTSTSSSVTLYAIWQVAQILITGAPVLNTTTGTSWTYTPTVSVGGCTLTVSGASWLSVVDGTVFGTPTQSGSYQITVTANKAGYTSGTQTFTVNVVPALSFDSLPSGGAIAYAV